MRAKDIEVGMYYAVRVRAKDIPVEDDPEDLGFFSPGRASGVPWSAAAPTRGRALSIETVPGNAFITMEVEYVVARRCPTCQQGLVHDEDDEIIYDERTITVMVPSRSVLNAWEAWQAEGAARHFERLEHRARKGRLAKVMGITIRPSHQGRPCGDPRDRPSRLPGNQRCLPRNPRQGGRDGGGSSQRVRPPRPLQGRDIGAGLASEAPRDLPRVGLQWRSHHRKGRQGPLPGHAPHAGAAR